MATASGFCGESWNALFRPFSLVAKVTDANGRPAAKLSNNPNKATGQTDVTRRYLEIFGDRGLRRGAVEVRSGGVCKS